MKILMAVVLFLFVGCSNYEDGEELSLEMEAISVSLEECRVSLEREVTDVGRLLYLSEFRDVASQLQPVYEILDGRTENLEKYGKENYKRLLEELNTLTEVLAPTLKKLEGLERKRLEETCKEKKCEVKYSRCWENCGCGWATLRAHSYLRHTLSGSSLYEKKVDVMANMLTIVRSIIVSRIFPNTRSAISIAY